MLGPAIVYGGTHNDRSLYPGLQWEASVWLVDEDNNSAQDPGGGTGYDKEVTSRRNRWYRSNS